MMSYRVDLETTSLLYRPRIADTEIIEYRRYDAAAATQLANDLQRLLADTPTQDNSAAACLALCYLLPEGLCKPMTAVANEGEFWFVQTEDGERRFLRQDGNEPQQIRDRADVLQQAPNSLVFDLLAAVQAQAERFLVDELITPANRDDSEFLKQRWAMDYLYHNGVFGTFDK